MIQTDAKRRNIRLDARSDPFLAYPTIAPTCKIETESPRFQRFQPGGTSEVRRRSPAGREFMHATCRYREARSPSLFLFLRTRDDATVSASWHPF